MTQIDTYLLVLLTYISLYSVAHFAYKKFRARISGEPSEQELG